ncbi:MAG: hypothetical protein AB1635_13535 [Acidobacteriota bacterium]
MGTGLLATTFYLFVLIGGGQALDDEGSIGRGLELGAGAGIAMTERLDLEAGVERLGHDRPTPFLSWDGRLVRVMGRARYRFGARASRVVPFVAGGAGWMHSAGDLTERDTNPFSPTAGAIVDVRPWSMSGVAWEGGGGVEFWFGELFVRPEAYLTMGQLSRGRQVGVPEPAIIATRAVVVFGRRF